MKRLDLKVWFACNNMCLFCVQWDKRFRFPPKTKKQIFKELEDWRNQWIDYVVFTWGEPTVHPDILEIMKYAKDIWYKNIQLQTNGRTFSNWEFAKKLVEIGWMTEFGPSLHWFKPETHDSLVKSKGAWKEVIQWIKNAKKLWLYIVTNTVITKQNYKELPAMALLFVKLWVDQFQFAFPHILGSAWKNRWEIVPKKSEVISYIHRALDIGKKAWKICMTEAIPFCFMQWYERAIAEYNYMPDTKVFDAEWVIDSYTQYRWTEWKIKWPPCEKCKLNNICEWPWKEYPEMFGWEEFKAVV